MINRAFIARWTPSSFTYLNVTQFLGALNDNLYKLLAIFFLIQLQGIERSPVILSTTGAVFVLPFLLFSAPSGLLADRFSKRDIIAFTKLFELAIMAFALLAFLWQSAFGAYLILFLLAAQSALFAPSKYGILPELVANEKLSQANGLMTTFTFLAMILGTFFASFIIEITDHEFTLAIAVCMAIAAVGVMTSLCIEWTPPSGSRKSFGVSVWRQTYAMLAIAAEEPSLLHTIFGSAFFLFLGAYVQLNMIPFAVESLGLTDVQGGYLFLIVAIGIGTGSMLAGKISGKTAELALVPLSGLGMTIGLFLMEPYGSSLPVAILLILLVGALGGIFQVPLDSYIQMKSPSRYRGQIIGATNFLSFFGVLIASCLLYILSGWLALPASRGFTVLGCLVLAITLWFWIQFFDYVTRFIGMILSRLHFRTTYLGTEHLSERPALYICHHSAWNDTLLMLGAQRHRMKFFIEEEQHHHRWMQSLYKILRVVFVPDVEPWQHNDLCLKSIVSNLSRGHSVCLFVANNDFSRYLKQLRTADAFRKALEGTDYSVVPVDIVKREKTTSDRWLGKLFMKCFVPAVVTFSKPMPLDRSPT